MKFRQSRNSTKVIDFAKRFQQCNPFCNPRSRKIIAFPLGLFRQITVLPFFLKNLNLKFSRVLHSPPPPPPLLKEFRPEIPRGNHIPILSCMLVITLIRSQFMTTECAVNQSIPSMTSTSDLFIILWSIESRGLKIFNSQFRRIQSTLTLVPRGEFPNNGFSRGLNLQTQIYHTRYNNNEYDASEFIQ